MRAATHPRMPAISSSHGLTRREVARAAGCGCNRRFARGCAVTRAWRGPPRQLGVVRQWEKAPGIARRKPSKSGTRHAWPALSSVLLRRRTGADVARALSPYRERRRGGAAMKAPAGGAELEASASFASRLYWAWLAPLLTLAASRPLTPDDLPPLLPGDDAAAVTATFVAAWNAEVAASAARRPPRPPSAWRAFYAAFGADYMRAAIPLKPLWLGFVLLQAFAVRGLVRFAAASAAAPSSVEYTARAAIHWVAVASACPAAAAAAAAPRVAGARSLPRLRRLCGPSARR